MVCEPWMDAVEGYDRVGNFTTSFDDRLRRKGRTHHTLRRNSISDWTERLSIHSAYDVGELAREFKLIVARGIGRYVEDMAMHVYEPRQQL